MTMKLRASMSRKVMSETGNWYGSVTRAVRSVAFIPCRVTCEP